MAARHLRRCTILGLLIALTEVRGRAQAGTALPAPRFDAILQHCKLQTPVAAGFPGGGVIEIGPSQLRAYSSPFFHADDKGDLVFETPDDGATTVGTHYPRTELRSLDEWELGSGTVHALHGVLSIMEQPTSGQIVFAQIHGHSEGAEALKMSWNNGSLTLEVKTTLASQHRRVEVATGLKLGDGITYDIVSEAQRLSVIVAGTRFDFSYDASWSGEKVYSKAGNYLQKKAPWVGQERSYINLSLKNNNLIFTRSIAWAG